jgi:hypothetical protein
MLKKICSVVAQKTITKKGLSEFVAKAIPVVGGGVSVAVNVAVMLPMANRLKNELRKYYLSEEEIQELEAKEQVTFSDKASDVASDVAAGVINTVQKTREFGQEFGRFAKVVCDKTKSKLADVKSSGTQQEAIELQDETSDATKSDRS